MTTDPRDIQLDRCARLLEGLARAYAKDEAKIDETRRQLTGHGLCDDERVSLVMMAEARACVAAMAQPDKRDVTSGDEQV